MNRNLSNYWSKFIYEFSNLSKIVKLHYKKNGIYILKAILFLQDSFEKIIYFVKYYKKMWSDDIIIKSNKAKEFLDKLLAVIFIFEYKL